MVFVCFGSPGACIGTALNFYKGMPPFLGASELGSPGLRFYIITEYLRMQIIASIFIEYSIYTMGVGISMQVSNRISRKWLALRLASLETQRRHFIV